MAAKRMIIMRDAEDSFGALMVAQGMTDARARVISIYQSGDTVHVFAEYTKGETGPDEIDAAIEAQLTKHD